MEKSLINAADQSLLQVIIQYIEHTIKVSHSKTLCGRGKKKKKNMKDPILSKFIIVK